MHVHCHIADDLDVPPEEALRATSPFAPGLKLSRFRTTLQQFCGSRTSSDFYGKRTHFLTKLKTRRQFSCRLQSLTLALSSPLQQAKSSHAMLKIIHKTFRHFASCSFCREQIGYLTILQTHGLIPHKSHKGIFSTACTAHPRLSGFLSPNRITGSMAAVTVASLWGAMEGPEPLQNFGAWSQSSSRRSFTL